MTARTTRRRGALRFCIVTTAHVSNNPRVLKEADALHEAGHLVRVVAYDSDPAAAARDDVLMRTRDWRLQRVVVRPADPLLRVRWAVAGVRHEASRALFARGVRTAAVRDAAAAKHLWRMAAAAASEPCDVVVAHHAPALPAAGRAARRLGARLVFDYEDIYVGNVTDDAAGRAESDRIAAVELAWLPQCELLIASSGPIADAIAARYGVTRPTVVLNTFPLDWRDAAARDERVGDAPSFYWFSQVIGPNRGLEDAVAAVGRAGVPFQLHLRGVVRPEFRARLMEIAEEHGVASSLHLHDLAPPADLVALSANHDVGLALEPAWNENSRLALSNKLLTYFVAGNAVIATDTPGQRSGLELAPGSGILCAPNDVVALTEAVRTLATNRDALSAAKRCARQAAERRFSWEHDAATLVDALERTAA